MNFSLMILPFTTGIVLSLVIQFILLKSNSFVTWLVEFITSLLLKRIGTLKQNNLTNYLGIFFINMGIKFVEEIEDINVKEEIQMIKGQCNKLQKELLSKQLIEKDDVQYINELIWDETKQKKIRTVEDGGVND